MQLLQDCKPSRNFQKHSFLPPLTLIDPQCTVVEADELDIVVVLDNARMLPAAQFAYT